MINSALVAVRIHCEIPTSPGIPCLHIVDTDFLLFCFLNLHFLSDKLVPYILTRQMPMP
jgi:hypothetical protein